MSAPQHLPHDVLGNFCAGRRFQVQFEENAGDLPLLELDPQGLSGDELHSSVTEVCIIIMISRQCTVATCRH